MIPEIDPKIDLAFKWLFGREKNIPLLIDLLNAVLKPLHTFEEIISLELLNPFSEQDSLDDKLSIVDVKARDCTGRLFDVEMQLLFERSLKERLLFYWAELHQQQLHSGDTYKQVRQTITICLCNFIIYPQTDDYCLPFELCNRKNDLLFSSDILLVVLELPKFNLAAEKISNQLEAWLYFFRHAHHLDSEDLPKPLSNTKIQEAIEELIMLSQDDLEREKYRARVRVQRDELTRYLNYQEDLQNYEEIVRKHEGTIRKYEETIHKHEETLKHAHEQGLEQGLAQVRDREIGLLLRLLNKRFGKIREEVETQIRQLSIIQTETLLETFLDSGSLEDLEQWLAQNLKAE